MTERGRQMSLLKALFISMFLVGASVTYVAAYDFDAHEQLADLAAVASRIGVVLADDLSLSDGIVTVVRKNGVGRTIRRRIANGSSEEDDPDLRVLNHFHDPLTQWEAAGLRVGGVQIGQSSVLWQQNTAQDSAFVGAFPLLLRVRGGTWAWQTARQLFFDALRLGSPADRSNRFADHFGALGHLTHVVQDASVPAHARVSEHVKKFGVDRSDGYENFVDSRTRDKRANLAAGLPEFNVRFTPTNVPNATVPVARLIDTDLYQGPATATLLGTTEIGLAEYTNGNFLSDRTLFENFPLPRLSATELFSVTENGQQKAYLRKVRDGETVDFFARRGLFSSHPILAPTTQG